MRDLFFILFLISIGCNKPFPKEDKISEHDSSFTDTAIEMEHTSNILNSKYYTLLDTVIISALNGDTLSYSKKEFKDIIDNFPELTSDKIYSPDISYKRNKTSVDIIDSLGNKDIISFGSECGQDNYFLLYAYFLKKKNGEMKYVARRNNLIRIYNDINDIFENLNYGGTYFGHQQRRIIGYAEFAINWYSERKDFFDKSYDITKQKKLFINTLKQKISDEEDIDNNIYKQSEKEKRKKELYIIADDINNRISDNFYLKMAQEFVYEHY